MADVVGEGDANVSDEVVLGKDEDAQVAWCSDIKADDLSFATSMLEKGHEELNPACMTNPTIHAVHAMT